MTSPEGGALDSLETYKQASYEERLDLGLSVDRDSENFSAEFNMKMMQAAATKNSQPFLESVESVKYRNFRNLNSWHVKRQVNAMLVDSPRAHEHIMNLSRPVLLDLLMPVQPTVKDWKGLSNIATDGPDENSPRSRRNDKSTQRTKEYYPNVVGRFTGPHLFVRKEDGTIEAYPKWPERKNREEEDERLESIATHYSLPPRRGRLDAKDFVDVNYLLRLKKYWRSVLSLLSEILENYGPIRKEMSWLVYHIVNNDMAVYVLFDDLSLEYESRWFANKLTPEKRMQIAGLPGLESEPYYFTKEDAKQGVAELQRFVKEFEDASIPATLLKYKVSARTMKRRVLELAMAAVDGYEDSGNYQPAAYITEEILNQDISLTRIDRMLFLMKLSVIDCLVCHDCLGDYHNPELAKAWLQHSEKVLTALTIGVWNINW